MAMSPAEAMKKELSFEVERLERECDELLGKGERCIPVLCYSSLAIDGVAHRFRAAGWHVRIVDGSSDKFHPYNNDEIIKETMFLFFSEIGFFDE